MITKRTLSLLAILLGIMLLVLGYVVIKQSRENQRRKKDLIEVKGQLAKAKKDLTALEKEHTTLSKKYNYAKKLIDAYKKSPRRGGILDKTKVITGEVLAVSDKVNVIVISVGSDAGVTVGMNFTVYREDQYIGKVWVDRVNKEFSSATTIKEFMKDSVRVGDKVSNSPY